jgi:hypothetical protein
VAGLPCCGFAGGAAGVFFGSGFWFMNVSLGWPGGGLSPAVQSESGRPGGASSTAHPARSRCERRSKRPRGLQVAAGTRDRVFWPVRRPFRVLMDFAAGCGKMPRIGVPAALGRCRPPFGGTPLERLP